MNRPGRRKVRLKRKVRRALIVTVLILAVTAVLGAATYHFATLDKKYSVVDATGKEKKLTLTEMKKMLDVQTFYPGIRIDGVDISGKTKEEAAALLTGVSAIDASQVNISLAVDNMNYPIDFSAIKISSNFNDVINEAYNYGRVNTQADEVQSIIGRYETVARLQNTAIDYSTSTAADPAALGAEVHALLDPLESPAENAKATSFDTNSLAFVIEESSAGLDIDIDAAIAEINAAIAAGEYVKTIPVSSTVLEPDMTKEELSSHLGLVSSCTTKTTGDINRNTNISLVCKTINGLILQPGETFNFNESVGERTAENGYKEAGGIFDGTVRMELGGGICQANGTLFHSVMKADLQIDERYPHSWPSTYVDIGTDATVTWNGVNFQFTNNTSYPVAIRAYYYDQEVTVQIYGRPVENDMKIQIVGVVVTSTPPGPTEYVADPLAPAGTNTIIRSPHNEIKAECYKVYYQDGVEIKRELAFTSSYRAITGKISVGLLAPDGTICPMDPLTGVVTMPSVTPTVTPSPAAEPVVTEAPAA